MLDFVMDFLIGVWCNSNGAIGKYRANQRQARQRERVFSATQVALRQQRADEPWSRGLDYFADRPGTSSDNQ
ncbi:MAG TPA: hypothetical protein VHZ96_23120 [Frankiaceae bacterium]|nr:hypothetical protein [Frankiaceae bacterium]